MLKKFFDLSTPSPISSFGGTWWWTNSTIPPKNPPPYGTHLLFPNSQSYHYLVRHLLAFEGFVYFYFLHHRFQIKLRARLYQFLVKLNKLSSKGAKSHFQNQSRTNCNSAKKICSARLRVGFPRELISKHRFKNKYRLGVGVL